MVRRAMYRVPPRVNRFGTSNCRACGDEVLFIPSTRKVGRRLALHVPSLRKGSTGEWYGESHAAYCPKADGWRRRA